MATTFKRVSCSSCTTVFSSCSHEIRYYGSAFPALSQTSPTCSPPLSHMARPAIYISLCVPAVLFVGEQQTKITCCTEDINRVQMSTVTRPRPPPATNISPSKPPHFEGGTTLVPNWFGLAVSPAG